jgi:hypothetical protein
LESTPDNELRPEFVRQVDNLRRMIFRKLKPKMVNGRQVTGEMLCVLA